MEKTNELTAEQIRAQAVEEQARIQAVKAASVDFPEIQAEAIKDGWDESKTKLEVLKAENKKLKAKIEADSKASERPKVEGAHIKTESVKGDVKCIEAAAALRAGIRNPEKSYDSETLNKAQDLKLHSLTDMVRATLALEGKTLDFSRHETEGFLKAAFSTRAISNILSNLANKFILESYGTVEETWRMVSAIRPVVDFKAHTGNRLVMSNLLKEMGPGGEISHGELSDETRTIQAGTKALMLGITRQDIINDDLGALTYMPRKLGYAAARTLNNDFWTAFEAAVGTLFTEAHANTQTGGALSIANLKTAEKLFLDLEDADGNAIGTDPSILLVSTTNSAAAREIFASTNLITGEDATTTSANIYAGMFKPAVSRYLSAAPWYLLADPMAMPVMETAFLNGRQEPFVETADADFNTLGVQMRCYYDYGVAAAEWRAGVRSDS